MTKKVYGIDLGTTYSAIAYVNDDGRSEIIRNINGQGITPSVVYFASESNIIVGEVAKASALESPEDAARVITSIKRHMHDPNYTVDIFNKTYDPMKISSMILKKVIEDARRLGHDVQDVVITCPEYFKDLDRRRTRQAGKSLNVNVLDVLDEPVAAALDYAMREPLSAGQTVLVYDLGGGTFDVTVVQISEDRKDVKVVCSEGDHQLGGRDWDKQIRDYLLERFKDTTGLYINTDDKTNSADEKEFLLRFEVEVENLKKRLSEKDKERASVVIVYKEGRARIEMSRDDFDRITDNLLNGTMMLTKTLLQTAEGKNVHHIDVVLLVGGSTRMPQVEKGLRTTFAGTFDTIIQNTLLADEAVARGAAKHTLLCYIKKLRDEGMSDPQIAKLLGIPISEIMNPVNVTRVASHTYGSGGYSDDNDVPYIVNLIMRNEELPAKKSTRSRPRGITQRLRMAIYESNITDERSYDINAHRLVREKDWELNREVSPADSIEEILTLHTDGTLRLFACIAAAPEFELEYHIDGTLDPEQMRNWQENLNRIHVE